MLRVLGPDPGRGVISPLSLSSSPQHPSWVAPHEFIYCSCFYWSFFRKCAMHVLWVYLFFACCVLYLLFGFTFLYVQSCIVSLIVLLRPTVGINTCFFSDYKLYSYNKQYEEMWHLLRAVFFRKSFTATFLFWGSCELKSLQMPP